ncbi:MAG: 2-dehydropantoate 2-reductase [Chlamydiales bacterium]|jgi:2-dehydropantoate 2-reductase
MRLLVYGAGGVGGTLAGGLADAGNEVRLVARGTHGAAIAAHGLTFARPGGSVSYRLDVAATAVEAHAGGVDAVLLCVKSQDTFVVATPCNGALRALARSRPAPRSVHIDTLQLG